MGRNDPGRADAPATYFAAKASSCDAGTGTISPQLRSSGNRCNACTEVDHSRNCVLDALGSPRKNPAPVTTRSCSRWIASCSVDATCPDDCLNAARDFAVSLAATERAAGGFPATPPPATTH